MLPGGLSQISDEKALRGSLPTSSVIWNEMMADGLAAGFCASDLFLLSVVLVVASIDSAQSGIPGRCRSD